MPTAKNTHELFKMLNKKIQKSLSSDVANTAKNTLKEHAVEDVYDAYDSSYSRTGGLLQDRNIEVKLEDGNTLTVRSTRQENGRDIAQIIETGIGYSYDGLDEKIGARPFHEETLKDLENGLAKKALADGLRKQGLDIK